MHERGALSVLVNQLLSEDPPPRKAVIRLGPGMDEDVTKATFAHLVQGTRIAGMDVTWRRAFDLLTCLGCGVDYTGTKVEPCPVCGANGLVVKPAPEVAVIPAEAC